MGETEGPQRIVICGAGPVGALAALYAANRGDDVHVYEMRDDIRTVATAPAGLTKSINLALAERGLNAMRHADSVELLENILQDTVPMHSRMIHGRRKDGKVFQESQAYDTHGRYNQAVDRAGLNKRMLDVLEGLPNVTLHFNHKLTGANFAQNIAWLEQRSPGQNVTAENRPKEIEVHFDLFIGADGAHSATRFHLMKYANLFYQQEYIDKLWSEFHIRPTTEHGGFAIDPNHLHIWPADSVMFIAIPSSDGSFTCTLFASADHFDSLSKDPATSLPKFFDQHFPGVTPALIPHDELIDQFERNAHLPLISIKCSPHHHASSVVIVGDAAHAMVPFYGQGMNAGLEDVRVLFEKLDGHGVYAPPPPLLPANSSSPPPAPAGPDENSRSQRRASALAAYTAQRVPDAHAINDLALNNYREMSSHVSSPVYKVRKWMEETVGVWMPWTGWRTQYTRVSFENQRYSDVIREVRRQGRILAGVMGVVVLGAVGVGLAGFRRGGGKLSFMRHGFFGGLVNN